MNDRTTPHAAYADKHAAYFARERTEIAPLLPSGPGQALGRVLEVGCGAGGTMAWLCATYAVDHATGVELMPDSAATARASFDRVVEGSLEDPAVLDGIPPVDLILALDVLEHLADPAPVVTRLARLLRPGGAFIVSLPNVGHYTVALPLLTKGRWRYQDDGILDRTHLRFFDAPGARALLEQGGLAVDRLDGVSRIGFLDFPPFTRSRRLRWYGSRAAAMLLPRHLHIYQFLLRAVPVAGAGRAAT
jgi:SAM-dependent methyltransferase